MNSECIYVHVTKKLYKWRRGSLNNNCKKGDLSKFEGREYTNS